MKKAHGYILNRRPLRCERARVNRTIFISPKVDISPEETKVTVESFGKIEDFVEARNTNLPNAYEFEANEWLVKFAFRNDAIKAFNVCLGI